MLPFVFLAVNIAQWSSKELEVGLQHIPSSEHNSVLRYRFKPDQYRALASQLLKRYLFVKYLSFNWGLTVFDKSAFGKPIIVANGIDNVDFNVSHHGDWVVIAACSDGKIGVDVTKRQAPREDLDSFINCFADQLSEDEIQQFNSIKDTSQKLQLFFEIWCLKESYIKALGVGLHKDLKHVNFMSTKKNIAQNVHKITVQDSEEPQNNDTFRFNLSYIDRDHPVAICTNAKSDGFEDTISMTSLTMGQSQQDIQRNGFPFDVINFSQIIQCTESSN